MAEVKSEPNMQVSDCRENLLPHLESLERMMKLPVVEAAIVQGQEVYGKFKDYTPMFNWAFRTAEEAVNRAVNFSAPLVAPIAIKFDGPISYVDQTILKGIERVEINAPIIKEHPQEIYNQARNKVIEIVTPQISKVCGYRVAATKGFEQKAASLKQLSYIKVNEVLATQYGSMAVSGVDNFSSLAQRLLDFYFPREEDENDDCAPIAAKDDPVLHTVQTIGALSNNVARRVYRTVSRQIKVLKKDDLHEYVASLIAVLRLTQYLNFLNDKVQQVVEYKNTASTKTKKDA